jgi:hypothetical protein
MAKKAGRLRMGTHRLFYFSRKEKTMKRNNKFWLPLMLLMAGAALIGQVSCEQSTGPETEAPDTTTVKYGSTTVFSGYAEGVPEAAPLKVWMINWKNEWQGHANEFVITVGKDIINANKDRIDLMMLSSEYQDYGTPTYISRAELDILINKLRAGAPNKTINETTVTHGDGLTVVDAY